MFKTILKNVQREFNLIPSGYSFCSIICSSENYSSSSNKCIKIPQIDVL